MIKKIIFLFGTVLLVLPFWLAVKGVWKNDLMEQINQDFDHNLILVDKSAVFTVFDGSQYAGKVYPWLGYPVTILYEDELLGEGDNINHAPDEFRIKEVVLKHQNDKRLILQIDSWKIGGISMEMVLVRFMLIGIYKFCNGFTKLCRESMLVFLACLIHLGLRYKNRISACVIIKEH